MDFLQNIYHWFRNNKRNLPWRNTSDPYKIWISEIILQQTRVDQGKAYYLRFIENFPTVAHVAMAQEDEILKFWQGLGYYSRARNLHYTAKYIHNELNGKFPENHKELLQLRGIGPYTAAAIASIAFDLPHSAVDGNIYRVLARYFGIHIPIDTGKGKKVFSALAEDLLPEKHIGFHNQTLMEFGAIQCTPKSPECNRCPVAGNCYAFNHALVDKLPAKSKQTKQRNRYFYYYYIDAGDFTYLEKRTRKDIWQNLFQFPLQEAKNDIPENKLSKLENFPLRSSCRGNIREISTPKKHVLTHQIIFARLIHVEVQNPECLNHNFLQVNKKDISTFAVPRLMEKFIQELKLV